MVLTTACNIDYHFDRVWYHWRQLTTQWANADIRIWRKEGSLSSRTVASSETDIFGRRDSFGRKFYFNCGPKISHSPGYYPLGLQRGYSCGKEEGEFNSCFFWAFLRGEWVGGREIGKLSLPSVFPASPIRYSILGCSSLIIIRLFQGFSIKLTLNGGVFSGKMTGSFSSFGTIYVYVHHVSHVIRLGLGTILLEKWSWIISLGRFWIPEFLGFKPLSHHKRGKRCIVISKLVPLRFVAMSRSQSSPDIYKVSVTRANAKSVDEELLELCNLSGVTLDRDVFKILLDLIKLNVPPTSLVSVLKQIAATKGYRGEGHSALTGKLSGGSITGSSYDTSSLTTGTGSSLTSSQSTRSERSERIPISSRLREMRAHAMQQ